MDAAPSDKHRNGVELNYRALFDAVPGLYLILDRELRIVAVTDAYASETMIDKDAVAGRYLFDVFPENPAEAGGAGDLRASLRRVLDRGVADSMPVLRYDIRQADGSFTERYWNPVNFPLRDKAGNVAWVINRVENVTELVRLNLQRAAEQQTMLDQERLLGEMRTLNTMLATTLRENRGLRAEQAYLSDLVASSNDAIIARTLDGRIASWNKAAETMYGYTAQEVVGQPVSKLAPVLLASDAAEISARLERGEPVHQYETIRRRRDGTEFPVSLSASLVRNSAGEVTGSSAIVRDITEQRRAEEKLRGLQAELVHLSRWNTMGMMASTLAHELNQPLTAAMNYVRAATRTLKAVQGPAVRQAEEFLDKAVEENRLAGGIIRSLRDFIDKRSAGRRAENINMVVEEAISLSLLGTNRTVKARVTLDPALPPVMVDKIQVAQVLLNLIRNAVEAMEDTRHPELIIATAHDEPGFIGVSVTDNGPGLSREIASRLFQPFHTTKDKGMGIGLTICQSIIESHGGTIWALPVSPNGVCFRFRLPMAGDDADD